MWHVTTEISDDETVTYLMGIVRDGGSIAQVGFVPDGKVQMAPGAFIALVHRALDRLPVLAASAERRSHRFVCAAERGQSQATPQTNRGGAHTRGVEEGHGTTRIRLASALAVDGPGGDTLEGGSSAAARPAPCWPCWPPSAARSSPSTGSSRPSGPTNRPPTRPPTWPPSSAGPAGCSVPTCWPRPAGPTGWPPADRGWSTSTRWRASAEAATRAAAGEPALAVAAAGRPSSCSAPNRPSSTRPTPTGCCASAARPTPCAAGPGTCWPSRSPRSTRPRRPGSPPRAWPTTRSTSRPCGP